MNIGDSGKIFYITNIRLPTEKAHGVQIMKMCEAFANQGMAIELVVPGRLNKIKEDPFDYYGVKRNFKITKLPCLDFVQFGKIGFWIQSFSFSEVATWFVFWKKLKREKFICYTREEFIAFYLSNSGIKVVWEAHIARNNFFLRSLIRRGIKIVSISNGLAEFYKDIGVQDDNILVAHDGVDLDKFENIKKSKTDLRGALGLPLDKKIVAYVGKRSTIGQGKGVEELERDFLAVSSKYPNTRLIIVSDAKLNEVPSYLKASDVLVMNYPDIDHYAKHMSPLKMFEYMASGNPIVSTDLPSIREVLSESNSTLVSVGKIKEGILETLLNYELKVKLAKQARLDVEEYTWFKRAKKILSFV